MKKIITLFVFIFTCVGIQAQKLDGTVKKSEKMFMNLYFGGNAFSTTSSHKNGDNGYEMDYNGYGGTAAFEYALSGVRFMTEVGYMSMAEDWDMSRVGMTNNGMLKNEAFETPSAVTAMFYVGATPFGSSHRFQLPIYIGLGGDIMNGYPNKGFHIAYALKVRGIYYITNSVGLFADFNIKGNGLYKDVPIDETNFTNSKETDVEVHNGHKTISAGLGLVVNIGRKK